MITKSKTSLSLEHQALHLECQYVIMLDLNSMYKATTLNTGSSPARVEKNLSFINRIQKALLITKNKLPIISIVCLCYVTLKLSF